MRDPAGDGGDGQDDGSYYKANVDGPMYKYDKYHNRVFS